MNTLNILLFITTLWAGVVVGISFIAQPAKFGAIDLSRAVALSVGRRIFRAMHAVEALLAVAAMLLAVRAPVIVTALVVAAVCILAVQAGLLMPRLSRRVDLVLRGQVLPSSPDHLIFAALELLKLIALAACALWLH